MDKIHYIPMILYLNYIHKKNQFFFQLNRIKGPPILRLTLLKRLKVSSKEKKWPIKFVKKKKKKIKKRFFCENQKLDYPRFLGDFYYQGTINLPCISKPTSIRNWVTFCGCIILKWTKLKD